MSTSQPAESPSNNAKIVHVPLEASTWAVEREWKRLDDLCEGIWDCPHSTPKLVEDGPFVVRSQDMRTGVFDLGAAARVSEETYKERIERAEPIYGDIFYSREGTYFGIAAEMPSSVRVCLGQRMVLIRPDQLHLNSRFARYWLNSPILERHIRGFRDGTVAERLNMPTIRGLPVPAFKMKEQETVAEILGALDDKIEVNRRMNGTLEAMARAVFRDWFSRSELPSVRAEELTKRGNLTINDGYRAKNSELGNDGLPFLRAANLKNGFDTEEADYFPIEHLDKAGNKISEVGDVAFTSKGTIGRFAQVSKHTNRFVYSPQVCFWRSNDPATLHPAVLYCWMQSQDFLHQVDAAAGQTDMAPYVSLRDQRQMFVPDFDESHLEVAKIIEPLLDRKAGSLAENRTLATTRDLLLPKLMSGEIRLRDAERMVEDAL